MKRKTSTWNKKPICMPLFHILTLSSSTSFLKLKVITTCCSSTLLMETCLNSFIPKNQTSSLSCESSTKHVLPSSTYTIRISCTETWNLRTFSSMINRELKCAISVTPTFIESLLADNLFVVLSSISHMRCWLERIKRRKPTFGL